MLPSKDGSRSKKSALLSVRNAFERGAECDLGLSEAHVSAKKSVHRHRLFHILFYLGNAAELIVRFRVGESAFKIALKVAFIRKRKPLRLRAYGIKLRKFLRHILDGFFYPASGLLPISRKKL